MGTTKRGSVSSVAGRLLAMVVFMAGCLAGCASMKSGADDTAAGRIVWKVREQYVEVVPRERGADTASVANDHPASVTPAEIRRLLASVALSQPGNGTPAPLFSDTELKVLEDAGVKGLLQAGPDEDVVFAVFGYYSTLHGFLKETKVTTGRMFYQDGRLNLILGVVQREVMDNEDRRLNPFVPGSRLKQSAIAGRITAAAGGVPFTSKRPDWLVFTPYSSAPPVVEVVQPRPEPAAPVVVPAAPPLETPKRVERPAAQPKSLEERLILLNDLKQKGLITDDEYRAKRLRILDEL
ncbi:MAG: SHOCT domain-containing protein [Desulfuromonadales bacterium]|nr:MAG: SHOCT domain-containing protein [Desulfuromonadales bacterium]